MKKFNLLPLAALLSVSGVTDAATLVTVYMESGTQFLRDSSGTSLSAGTSAYGDGAVLQLGYYTDATSTGNFLGTWVPLTGEGSLNTGFLADSNTFRISETTVGDLSGGNGTFALTIEFTVGDPGTGNSLPNSTAIPLSIRFYNSNTIGSSTQFNVVSNDLWTWKTPSDPVFGGNSSITVSLDDPNLEWQGGASSAFKTTLPVPEPSTGLALLGGVALLVAHRRRR